MPRREPRRVWRYKGVNVYPAALNSSGMRWYAASPQGGMTLRSDSKAGMRALISAAWQQALRKQER